MRTRELINILYVESRVDASGHYVLIKDLAALERGINKDRTKNIYHPACGCYFKTDDEYAEHVKVCDGKFKELEVMPELKKGEKFKFAEFKSFKEQFYIPRIVIADFETRTSKYLYGVGSRVKQTADIKPSRSVCVTQDEFGNPLIKTFVSDDKQSCAVKLLEEFDRIHYNDMIRYIDHEIHGEDWRKINARNELDATRKKQLVIM